MVLTMVSKLCRSRQGFSLKKRRQPHRPVGLGCIMTGPANRPVMLEYEMPNDAKLGLVLGVALVLVIAVVFFRKEPAAAQGTSLLPGQVEVRRGPARPQKQAKELPPPPQSTPQYTPL